LFQKKKKKKKGGHLGRGGNNAQTTAWGDAPPLFAPTEFTAQVVGALWRNPIAYVIPRQVWEELMCLQDSALSLQVLTQQSLAALWLLRWHLLLTHVFVAAHLNPLLWKSALLSITPMNPPPPHHLCSENDSDSEEIGPGLRTLSSAVVSKLLSLYGTCYSVEQQREIQLCRHLYCAPVVSAPIDAVCYRANRFQWQQREMRLLPLRTRFLHPAMAHRSSLQHSPFATPHSITSSSSSLLSSSSSSSSSPSSSNNIALRYWPPASASSFTASMWSASKSALQRTQLVGMLPIDQRVPDWWYPCFGHENVQNIAWLPSDSMSATHLVAQSGKLATLDTLLHRLKRGGHRVLIYCQMTRMIDLLEEFLRYRHYTYIRLDGSTKIADRRDMVEDWQTQRDIFVFLLSTRAGGQGINLTAADTVIFYELDWNPTMDQQAMDRTHRLGQTKAVTVYRLVTLHSVEERILKRAHQKSEIQSLVIAPQSTKNLASPSNSELMSMLVDDNELQSSFFNKVSQSQERKRGKKANKPTVPLKK
jgi:hypothetical protein